MFDKIFGNELSSPLIKDAVAEIFSMLEKEETMFREGVKVLLENKEAAFNIAEADEDINTGERMIRRMVIEHLSLNPAKDLPASLILVSIVQDVERLGDFAKGLLEINSYSSFPRKGDIAEDCKKIAYEIIPQFDKVRKAFLEYDVELARDVMNRHREIKRKCKTLLKELAAGRTKNPKESSVYTMAAIVLRRVSAHLSNVASTVVQPFDKIRHDEPFE